jgi:hypothetical protein
MTRRCRRSLLEELAGRWFARFERALVRRGFSALESQGGPDVRTVTAASSGALGVYLAKLELEVTGGPLQPTVRIFP